MTSHPNRSRAADPGEPKKLGRPVGSGLPPEQQTKPRSIRLDDARWAKLQALGRDWLERKIDAAR